MKDVEVMFKGLPEELPRGILMAYVKHKVGEDKLLDIRRLRNILTTKKLTTMKRYQAKDYLAFLITYRRLRKKEGKLPLNIGILVALFEGYIMSGMVIRSERYLKTRLGTLYGKYRASKILRHAKALKLITYHSSGFYKPTVPIERGLRVALIYNELKYHGLVKEEAREFTIPEFVNGEINLIEFLDMIKEKYHYFFDGDNISESILKAIVDYELSYFKDIGLNKRVSIEEVIERIKAKRNVRNIYYSLQDMIRRIDDANTVFKLTEHLLAVKQEFGVVPAEIISDWAITEFGNKAVKRIIEFASNEILTFYENGAVEIADYNTIKALYQPDPVAITGQALAIKIKLENYAKEHGVENISDYVMKAKKRGEKWALRVKRILPKKGIVIVNFGKTTVKIQLRL